MALQGAVTQADQQFIWFGEEAGVLRLLCVVSVVWMYVVHIGPTTNGQRVSGER